jgi:hypothetical protein
MPKFLLIYFTLFLAATLTVKAQTWEIGGTLVGSGYMGDFNPNHPLKFTDLGLGVMIKRNFNGYFSLKGSITHGTIRGADSLSSYQQLRDRNLSFVTILNELSLTAELNLVSYIPQIGRNRFAPFIFLGIGTVSYDPKTTYKGTDYQLRPLMTEGQAKPYNEQVLVIPYGAGVKYNLGGQWNLIVDLGYRTPKTNYLDDVSGAYADKSTLISATARALSDRSGERTGVYIGTAGSQRGNMRTSDTYMFLGFTISYTIFSPKCYVFN